MPSSLSRFGGILDQAETLKIYEDSRLEQFLGTHRQFAAPAVGACEQRGDPMRQSPQMQAHHQSRRPTVAWQARAERVGGATQYRKSAIGGLAQTGIAVERQARLEHGRVESRFFACKGEIGTADILEGDKGIRAALIPGAAQTVLEQFEAAARHIGE